MIIHNLFPLLADNVRDWKPHLGRAADRGFDWVFRGRVEWHYSRSANVMSEFTRDSADTRTLKRALYDDSKNALAVIKSSH